MKFRPCIDLHEGRVKQIIGATLTDAGAAENFVSSRSAAEYAAQFREDNLPGGHIIMLDALSEEAAFRALAAYPGGMQIGGGILPETARRYLRAGASHVIATSAIFRETGLHKETLYSFQRIIGPNKLVLDLSCARGEDGAFRITANRWRTMTAFVVTPELLFDLTPFCDEFLIHAVQAEGRKQGFDEALAVLLSTYKKYGGIRAVTYAGGLTTEADIARFETVTGGLVDYTVGSALDLYGGKLSYRQLVEANKKMS